jgi:hypothetical protein
MTYIYVKTLKTDSNTRAFLNANFLRSTKNREYYKIVTSEESELDSLKNMLEVDDCVLEYTVRNKPRKQKN